MKYYWVYLPEIDESGTVLEAEDFEDAFLKGCEMLVPEAKVEVQVHELGASREFVVPNYPFTSADECNDFCSPHAEGCDGYCDHIRHRNMCLNDAEFAELQKEYDNA